MVCVESDEAACAAADANLADLPQAEVWQGEVDAEGLAELLGRARAARRTSSSSTRRGPGPGRRSAGCSPATGARAVVYVACDPAALARDVAAFAEAGYRLAALRGVRRLPDDRARRVRGPARPGLTRAVRYGLGVPTWEYASVITANDAESQRAGVSIKLPGGESERQQGDTSSVLNSLGAEGWELVSYHSSGAGTWGFEQFWLKRQSAD